nr:VCBS repeat-containing protein [bacterium]
QTDRVLIDGRDLVVQAEPEHRDIDDIAFASDLTLYAVVNERGKGDLIAVIDPVSGQQTVVGAIYCPIIGVRVQDMEGLGFGCDGELWGVTGNKNVPEVNNRLWNLQWAPGTDVYYVCNPHQLSYGSDYEGVTCGDFPAPGPTPAQPVFRSGDYNGDGTDEIAVFRPGTGLWAVMGEGSGYFGQAGDVPVPGDWDGSGTDLGGVFRPASGFWSVRLTTRFYFGGAADVPVPADYDGDGSVDGAVFRPSAGTWILRNLGKAYFGAAGDRPVPADYDGDGTADVAVWRAANGLWALEGISRFYFGRSGDIPAYAAFAGGADLPAVFRPASGTWLIRGLTRFFYGQTGDVPVPADYTGTGTDLPAVYRKYRSSWHIRGLGAAYFGRPGDVPVTR